MNRADLEELLAKCEAATGPDREIDGAIALSVGWTFQKMKGDSKPYWRVPGETRWYVRSDAPRYTSSLDAIVDLIERELPDVALSLSGPPWDVELHNFINPAWAMRARAETLPLALCSAFIRARLASGGNE